MAEAKSGASATPPNDIKPIIIKKYANRRLYNTKSSSYITLEHLAAMTREVLWNGNREPLTNFTSLDPYKNIIVWTWVNHDKYTERYADAMADPAWSHLRFIRLRSHAEAGRWLTSSDARG